MGRSDRFIPGSRFCRPLGSSLSLQLACPRRSQTHTHARTVGTEVSCCRGHPVSTCCRTARWQAPGTTIPAKRGRRCRVSAVPRVSRGRPEMGQELARCRCDLRRVSTTHRRVIRKAANAFKAKCSMVEMQLFFCFCFFLPFRSA